jgi:hypothetical protein
MHSELYTRPRHQLRPDALRSSLFGLDAKSVSARTAKESIQAYGLFPHSPPTLFGQLTIKLIVP